MEVSISLEILRFIPNEWCGPYRGVSPLIADTDRDRGWGWGQQSPGSQVGLGQGLLTM